MRFKGLKTGRKKLALAAAVGGVLLYALVGDKGLLDVLRLKSERDGIVRFNRTLVAENAELEREIKLLKTDDRYIGRVARTELGMIGKNEIIYRLGEKNP